MKIPARIFFFSLLLLTGCSEGVVYQQDVAVPEGIWQRSFTPEFTFDIADTVGRYDVFIDLRHTGDYAYSDLYLFVHLQGPGGRELRDTVQCLLADPMGKWYGKGVGFLVADRYQADVLYKLRNRFPAAGRYSIRLEQAMRTEGLEGVIDVGVSVERSKNNGR
ncbi:MAG: gliding motility lipoprotein GldH [Flavobacteriales bacterium]|nr:gliding motility lipoprotein GldH [Flavobacteriales bacterium]